MKEIVFSSEEIKSAKDVTVGNKIHIGVLRNSMYGFGGRMDKRGNGRCSELFWRKKFHNIFLDIKSFAKYYKQYFNGVGNDEIQ